MKFSELGLEPSLEKSIQALGYQECTPIQEAIIPEILKGRDVSGLAQTGTGKTGAFLIPLMDRILKSRLQPAEESKSSDSAKSDSGDTSVAADASSAPAAEEVSEGRPQFVESRFFKDFSPNQFILVLVPTRELAEQVYQNIEELGKDSNLRGVAVYGGTGYDKQKEGFKSGVEFCVATPGRLIDLYKDHVVDLKQVRAIVFDEADRMFDMGFKDDMKFILQRVPRERQFLVFSATLNFDVMNTAYQFGAEPLEVNVSKDQAKAENVKDSIFHVGFYDKPAALLSLLNRFKPQQAMVFSNFKMNVERLAHFLTQNGHAATGISSLLTQAQRNRVIEMFRDSKTPAIMVATDVAARGLDIKGVDLVVNFELPDDAESYVHRIGRTGRAGAEGLAFSLVSDRDVEALGRIENYLKHKVEIGWIEDSEIIKEFVPFPSESEMLRFGRSPSAGGGSGRRDERGGGGGGRGPRREGDGRRGGGGQGRPDHRAEGRSDNRAEGRSDRGPSERRPPRGDQPNDARMQARGTRKPGPIGPKAASRRPDGPPGPGHPRGDRSQGRDQNRDSRQDSRPDNRPREAGGATGPNRNRRDRNVREGDFKEGQGRRRPQNGPGQRGPNGTSGPGPAPQKSAPTIVSKVSAFFKKIFVGSSQSK